MSIERDEMLARLLQGIRDGVAQALELLTVGGSTTTSNPEARGKAAGIMQAQVAMLDAVLPLGAIPIKDDDKGDLGGAGPIPQR